MAGALPSAMATGLSLATPVPLTSHHRHGLGQLLQLVLEAGAAETGALEERRGLRSAERQRRLQVWAQGRRDVLGGDPEHPRERRREGRVRLTRGAGARPQAVQDPAREARVRLRQPERHGEARIAARELTRRLGVALAPQARAQLRRQVERAVRLQLPRHAPEGLDLGRLERRDAHAEQRARRRRLVRPRRETCGIVQVQRGDLLEQPEVPRQGKARALRHRPIRALPEPLVTPQQPILIRAPPRLRFRRRRVQRFVDGSNQRLQMLVSLHTIWPSITHPIRMRPMRAISILSVLLAAAIWAATVHAEELVEDTPAADFAAGAAAYGVGEIERAFEIWLPLGEAGDPQALLWLGIIFDNGWSPPKDAARAAQFFRRAYDIWLPGAKAGDVEAQYNIGMMLYFGRGVPKDWDGAFNILWRAAEQAHAGAEFEIGSAFEYGWGVEEDHGAAFEWYWRSAMQGYVDAYGAISRMYCFGKGVTPVNVLAYTWKALFYMSLDPDLDDDAIAAEMTGASGCRPDLFIMPEQTLPAIRRAKRLRDRHSLP